MDNHIRTKLFFIVLSLAISGLRAQSSYILEAESATLTGTANAVNCNNASGTLMVRDLSGGEGNSVLFENIDIDAAGSYFVTISYFAANDRNLSYKINGGEERVLNIPASGVWCYQGGFPADFRFEETFAAGSNQLLLYDAPLIDKVVISADTMAREPATFYLSAELGNDDNNGLTSSSPWKSLQKINEIQLVPGDSILFQANNVFDGELSIVNEGGAAGVPIVISSYGEGQKPVLDGVGFESAIHVVNSGYLHISGLEIKNDRVVSQPNEPTNVRYGIFIEHTRSDGSKYEHYRFNDLIFREIYPTETVTDNDRTGVNAHAINLRVSVVDEAYPDRFADMVVEDCYFTRIGRHAAVFRGVKDLTIRNNVFEQIGGAGMLIGSNCSDILVEYNVTNYTGSSIDSRMAGRGSGIWCYRATNLIVQYNMFKHARGISDSYGMHIDTGNRNVVYQYNYSEDNEGGFVEILGANVNVGYRFNLSVGDGWRERGNQNGRIFWFSGWSGNTANPIGSDSIFVYNNSIYVRSGTKPGIQIVEVTMNTRIYNNIVYVANNFGEVVIENAASLNDFNNNIWYGKIPLTDTDGESFMGTDALVADPMFSDRVVSDASGFLLQEGSPAIGAGKLVYDEGRSGPFSYYDNNVGLDYFGNPVPVGEKPNIGASNQGATTSLQEFRQENTIVLFPNPVIHGQPIHLEIPDHLTTSVLDIYVYDAQGNLVIQERNLSGPDHSLGTQSLPMGVYWLKVESGNFHAAKKILLLK